MEATRKALWLSACSYSDLSSPAFWTYTSPPSKAKSWSSISLIIRARYSSFATAMKFTYCTSTDWIVTSMNTYIACSKEQHTSPLILNNLPPHPLHNRNYENVKTMHNRLYFLRQRCVSLRLCTSGCKTCFCSSRVRVWDSVWRGISSSSHGVLSLTFLITAYSDIRETRMPYY